MLTGTESSYSSYSKPDTMYYRPELNPVCTARQAAVCACEEGTWISSINHWQKQDRLIIVFNKPGIYGKVNTLEKGQRKFFSKPVFLKRQDDHPELFCAVAENGQCYITRYCLDNSQWYCREKISTSCESIYYMDAIEGRQERAVLVYAGVSSSHKGLQVYSRSLEGERWSRELIEEYPGASVNRPKLALNGSYPIVVADAYFGGKFHVIWKRLSEAGTTSWQAIVEDAACNMFVSVVKDKTGSLWASWLREIMVRREDVMGLSHRAQVARFESDGWQIITDNAGEETVANLNLGLLPIERYFGYSGLRRYPRLLAASDGGVWLLWEQQRDEVENWDNVENGLFLGKKYKDRVWSGTRVLADGGNCHCFDEMNIYPVEQLRFCAKSDTPEPGNDFGVLSINPEEADTYQGPPESKWQDWYAQKLPIFDPRDREQRRNFLSDSGYVLLFGDMHCHTVFSPDAEGEPDEQFFFARDVAEIDFVCLTDNDYYPPKALLNSEVEHIAAIADSLTEKDRFAAFCGYEYTFYNANSSESHNHRIVIFTENDKKIIRRIQEEGRNEQAFLESIKKTSDLIFPHHAEWSAMDIPNETFAEVTSAWGNYILASNTIHNNLMKGRKLGFAGCSDNHRFLPGLGGAVTGVYCEKFDRESIIDALRKRRCFATTGNRTAVGFWANDCIMGQEAETVKTPELRWKVLPQEEIEKIEIIRDGDVVHSNTERIGTWKDNSVEPGRHWYYLRVREKGDHKKYPHNLSPAFGKWAWSSPIWVSIG